MRPRFFDILSVLGVAILLAWAPGYLAQDPASRQLAGGQSFKPVPPMYGDTAELEILLTIDSVTYTSGPVVTVRLSEPLPDKAPRGAVLLEEHVHHAAAVDFGPLRYRSDERTIQKFYDANGVLVWEREISPHLDRSDMTELHDGLLNGTKERPPRTVDAPPHEGAWGFLTARPMHPLTYSPDIPMESLYHYVWNETESNGPPRSAIMDVLRTAEPAECTIDAAGETVCALNTLRQEPIRDCHAAPNGTLKCYDAPLLTFEASDSAGHWDSSHHEDPELLRALPAAYLHRGRALYAHQVVEAPSTAYLDYRAIESTLIAGGSLPLWLRLDAPNGISVEDRVLSWTWWLSDFPVPVGSRAAHLDAEGNQRFIIDLVPYRVSRGDRPADIDWFLPAQGPWAVDAEPVVPMVTLASLRHDERSLFDGHSFGSLYALLAAEAAPESIRSLLAEGGIIVAAAWSNARGPGSEWLLRLAKPNAEGAVVLVQLEPAEEAQIEVLCLAGERRSRSVPFGPYGSVAWNCRSPAGMVEPERAIADPIHIADAARIAQPNGTETGAMIPASGALFSHPPFGAGSFSLISRNDDEFVAEMYSLETGALSRRDALHLSTPAALAPDTLTPAAVVASPQLLSPIGPTLAYGGLALVALGLIARLAAAWHAGALAPLGAAFYARVHREKALDHDRRELLATLIRENPGIPLMELARRAEVHRSIAYHHLQTLERTGLAAVLRLGRVRHYFPPGSADPATQRRHAAAWHGDWHGFLDAVEAQPGITLRELEGVLPARRSALSRMGSRLAAFGLVVKQTDGAHVRFFPRTGEARQGTREANK